MSACLVKLLVLCTTTFLGLVAVEGLLVQRSLTARHGSIDSLPTYKEEGEEPNPVTHKRADSW